jgi:hypothetical protein
MAAPKGHPRYGGRKKGTPNKKDSTLALKSKELGIDPFEILLLFAKGDWEALGYPAATFVKEGSTFVNEELYIKPETRARAAAEAAQYIYPKLKAIEHSGDKDNPVQLATQLIILPDNGRSSKDP